MTKQTRIPTWFWVVVGIVALLGVLAASQVRVKKTKFWNSEATLQTMVHGSLFSLSEFLKAAYPHADTAIFPGIGRFEQEARDRDDPAIVFVAEQDSTDPQMQDKLLAWVARGNTLVIPSRDWPDRVDKVLPNGTIQKGRAQKDEEKDTASEAASAASTEAASAEESAQAEALPTDKAVPEEETDTAEPADNSLPETPRGRADDLVKRLGATIVKLEFPQYDAQHPEPQPTHIPPACQAAAQKRLQAEQAVGDDFSSYQDNFEKERQADCSRWLSTLSLPEGKTLSLLIGRRYSAAVFELPANAKPLWVAKNAYGITAARLPYGRGSVVILTRNNLWAEPQLPYAASDDLSQFDHAYLAAYLAADKRGIWYINSLESLKLPSKAPLWWRWLKKAPWAVGLLLLFTVMGIWHAAYRIGPIIEPDERVNRRFANHLYAQGMFLWRYGRRQAVLQELQQALLQEWRRRISGFDRLDAASRINEVRRISGATVKDIRQWLEPIPADISLTLWLDYLKAHQRLRSRS